MPTINNIEFLTLPQQVQKNKRDVATLQTEAVDKAVAIADEFNNLHIRLNSLEYRADETDDVIGQLITATGDTGWLPLTITNEVVSTNPSKTAMFIRKIGNVVSITGKLYFDSAYSQNAPSGFLVQLPLAYRPTKLDVEGPCVKYVDGVKGETNVKVRTDGYILLTTAEALNTRVDITVFMYLAQ